MSRKAILTFTLLVLVLTFAIKWSVLDDTRPQVVALKTKPMQEPETVHRVQITAVMETRPLEASSKTDKAQEVKELPVPAMQSKKPELAKQLPTRHEEVTEKNIKIIEVTKSHAEKGLKLLKGKSPAPLLELGFMNIGFSRYIAMMQGLGARIFVADAGKRSLVAEAVLHIDGLGVSFIGFKEGSIDVGGLAAMPREIVDEDIVDVILSKARRTFKGDDLRCVVILPVEKEAAFMGAIHEAIGNAGYRTEDFSLLRRVQDRRKDEPLYRGGDT